MSFVSKKTVLRKIFTFLPPLGFILLSLLFSFKLWHSVLAFPLSAPETPPLMAPESPPESPPGIVVDAPYPTKSSGIYYSSISTYLVLDSDAAYTWYSYEIVGEDWGGWLQYTDGPITINFTPDSTIRLVAFSSDINGVYSGISYTYYQFDDTPVSIDIGDMSSLIDNLVFTPINSGLGNSSVTQVNVEITITVPNSLGTTNSIILPEFTRISRVDNLSFTPSSLVATDVSFSAISGLSSSTSIEGAFQWGIPNLGLIFSNPITINIYVGTHLNNQTLNIARSINGSSDWTTDGIVSPGTCLVSDGYCQFQATKASYYVATSQVSVNSNSSSSNPVSNSPYNPYYCGDSKPSNKPNLFQIDVNANTAKIYFTPLKDTSDFYVSFSSVNINAEEHGGHFNLRNRDGIQSYTIYQLKPNTAYYFKVRGQNGCMPGDWSNILIVKTTSKKSITKKYYTNTIVSIANSIKSGIKKIIPKSMNKMKVVSPEISTLPSPTEVMVQPLVTTNFTQELKPTITISSTPQKNNIKSVEQPTTTPTAKKKCFLWWCW